MMRGRDLLRLSVLPQLVLVVALFGQGNASSVALSTIAPEDIGARIAAIQGQRSAFASDAQRAKLNEVASYVHSTLAGYGLAVSDDPVTYAGQMFPNIVGTLRGTTCPYKTFIVSAHYDGVSVSPAADDNASGVAAVLEMARVLSAQPLPASVDFVAFSFEEQGTIGSAQMADAARSANRPLAGVINFDMIAYTCDVPGCQSYHDGIPQLRPAGDFIAAIANTASHSLLEGFTAASASAVPGLIAVPLEVTGNGETAPDARRSDHAPFWNRGYQALFLTDTANLRNPNYHQAGDTLDTLNLGFAADVANAAAATVADVLTADANGDGRADVCAASSVGGSAELPQPQASSQSESDSSSSHEALAFAIIGAGGVALLVAAGGWYMRERRQP